MSPEIAGLRPADRRLALPAAKRLRINEIFYSIQGESSFAGRPCVLVRLTGCQMRCVWCDSEYSFYEGTWRTLNEVIAAVELHGCPLVEITGGEPLLQPGVLPLMQRLCDLGYEVLLETGGGIDITPVDARVHRILDIKCPGSGEADNNLWSNLSLLGPGDEIKFVISDRRDYEWARDTVRARELDRICPVHFSPVSAGFEPAELAGWILEERLPVRLSLQVHKVLWGSDVRGV